MHVDRRLVGWGLMFIVIGAVPLAVNQGLLGRDVVGRWPELWPLLIVAIGVSLILTRTGGAWIGSLSVALVVGLMGGGLLATGLGEIPSLSGCGGGTAQAFPTQTGSLTDGANVDVEFDCGTLDVGTTSGGQFSLGGNDGAGQAPSIATTAAGVTMRSANPSGPFARRGNVTWNLALPTDPTLSLGVTLNAGRGDLELAQAKLTSLNATVNAGSLVAVLGSAAPSNAVNLTVNAGSADVTTGATSGSYNLSLNAGSLNVCVPQGTPVRVRWSGALASHDFDGLNLVKVDDHTWTSSGFDPNAAHLELDVSANAGSFGLHYGGGCGA
jgi:hypothetical protein